jgi:hypothetical protein
VKLIIVILILLVPPLVKGQASVLLLKKNGKTIERFYTGKNFVFTTKDGMPVRGQLDSIVRDSLFLTYFQEQRVGTQYGTTKTQITGKYDLKFSMANVGSLPRPGKSKLIPGILILGGLGYTTVNIVNTVADGDPPFGKDNIVNVLAGLGAAAAGWLMLRVRSTKYVLGEKYTLEVIN